MRRRWMFSMMALASLLALVAFAACGDDDDDGGDDTGDDTTGEVDITSVAELEDSVLKVGSDIAYPPIEYFEEGTTNATGLDVDLMNALGAAMGVEVEFEQVADFAGIVGDLKASRYDVVMSAISITEEREAEIDFVEYFGPAGTGVLVPAGNPNDIATIEDICGLTVAAQVGTIQVDYMEEFNGDQCADNPIEVKAYPDTPTVFEELRLGRVDAGLADDPVAAYAAAQSDGKLVVAATGFDSAPYGIGVRKDSAELNTALKAALAAIKASGKYASVLADWGQEAFAQD